MTPRVCDPAGLAARRILAIAPHPDDESLGCGGLLASLAAQGRKIHVVFITDGSASHRNSPTWPRARLAERREAEAEAALARLGLASHGRTFLRLRDSAMPARHTPAYRAACSTLSAIAREQRPDLVLLPWRRDPHCDHRDSWLLARDAIAAAGLHPEVLEYAIWLDEWGDAADAPLPGEAEKLAFDVAPAMAAKRAAIAEHRTQTTDLIADAPGAFRLTPATIHRLSGPRETYWSPT